MKLTAAQQRIRAIRAARGWTLRQLARRAKLSKSALGRMENGEQDPRSAELEAIAKAFELSMPDFYSAELEARAS